MNDIKIFENFLPEELLSRFVNILISGRGEVYYTQSEEEYESDILEKNEYVHDNEPYLEILKKHNVNLVDRKYDIQNVLLLRDAFGKDYNLNPCFFPYPWRDIDSFIQKTLSVKLPLRTKINISFCKPTRSSGGFHTDMHNFKDTNIPHKTLIVYLNDNNGGTMFEDGTLIQNKRNTAVLFNGHTKHAPISHTNTKRRVVLNYNFI